MNKIEITLMQWKKWEDIKYTPKLSTFPGGEEHVNVKYEGDIDIDITNIQVKSVIKNSQDFMRTVMVCAAVCEHYKITPVLFIPYLPYSRQDRVCNSGEAFAKKVALNLLKQYTQAIYTWDCHSDIRSKQYKNISQDEIIACSPLRAVLKSSYVVAPDKGASKKVGYLEKMCLGTFQGEKKRDPTTGKLSGFDVNCNDFQGKDLIIVDDICDGGGTFLGLGKLLRERNCGKLSLYVTHGIFSQGFEELDKVFDNVYCSPSLRPVDLDWKPIRKEDI